MSPKNLSVDLACLLRDAVLTLLSLHGRREDTLHISDRPVWIRSLFLASLHSAPGCTYPADELFSGL